MAFLERAKSAGAGAAGLVLIVGLMLVAVAFLIFAAEFSVWALEWVPSVFAALVFGAILILLPLGFIPATRGFSSAGFSLTAQLFGLILLVFSMAYVYLEWGLIPVIIGLFLGGIGPIPIAAIISVIEGDWAIIGNQVVVLAAMLGSAFVGSWFSVKAQERALLKAAEESRAMNAKPAKRIDRITY